MIIRNNLILILTFIIVALSLLTLYSASYADPPGPFKWGSVFMRQLMWIIFGWLAFFIFSKIYYRKLLNFVIPFYILVVFSLLLVLVIGGVRLGAQRWIKIWWFNFQPSEFAKLAVILSLSYYFSRKNLGDIRVNTYSLSFYRGIILPFMIILLPFMFILKQPDLGSALMLLFIFLGMVYFSGVKTRYVFLILVSGIILCPILWHFLRDYQKDRLLVFLNPNHDPLGAGYTIIQSKVAIGSGRLFGKGWLSGTQGQLNFLPEAHTDFIFGIFAEEAGLLGSIILFSLYFFIINEAIAICNRIDDNFAKLLSFGIAFMLGIQVYINISMTLGISPVVGLPLPLMSYGGSSMLVTFICLGILKNVDKRA